MKGKLTDELELKKQILEANNRTEKILLYLDLRAAMEDVVRDQIYFLANKTISSLVVKDFSDLRQWLLSRESYNKDWLKEVISESVSLSLDVDKILNEIFGDYKSGLSKYKREESENN